MSMASEHCDAMIRNHAEAVQTLASHPPCTDAVISALERFSRTDPRAISDLSAAFYLRAQREDRPSDLLRALEAGQQAVGAAPASPDARFNLALIEQSLGLSDDAIASWNAFLRMDESAWRGEATAHRDRLRKAAALHAMIQWPRHRDQLRNASANQIARFAGFPYATQRFIEEELLPQWAENPTPAALERARLLASELSKLTGDRYVLDVVNAITPARQVALQEGHLALRDARVAETGLGRDKAGALYETAIRALESGGSPLRLGAAIGLATNMRFLDIRREREVFPLLDAIANEARKRGYLHLQGRVHHTRALNLFFQNRHVEALAEYDAALPFFRQVRDLESIASVHGRKVGILRILGQYELAWREVAKAQSYASHLIELRNLNALGGEIAEAAVALAYPRAALRFQAANVGTFRKVIRETPPHNLDRIAEVNGNLGIALRSVAGIEMRLGHHELARQTLDEAMRLSALVAAGSQSSQRALFARIEEVRAQTLIATDRERAIAAFTQAITLSAESKEHRTFRANLFVQRAEVHRRTGNSAAATSDLQEALGELRAEESEILEHRERGKAENLWSTYFARFQDTYRLLIRQLVEEGKAAEAFGYAEKARAFEPLNLVLQLAVVPPRFQRLLRPDGTIALTDIQATLPHGTFLISYCVLDDRTYAWIVTSDRVELLTLPVRRQDIERWSADLQRASRRTAAAFELGLAAPYVRLLAEPLETIAKMPGGQDPARRLVFIPDAAIHGLPLAALRNPDNRRYLVQDATIEIAGSATLYVFSRLRDAALASPASPSVLLVGDPAFDEGLALSRGMKQLPLAQREVDRIRPLYAPRVTMLLDRDATADAFLALARQHTIVHFAGHAIANANAPSRSLLLLAPTEKHSGALDAEELLTRVQLTETRLVVLSACSSAGGSPVGPEGVAPLVRPMLAAGAPAVIGALWDVEDADAEALLVAFHRHYRAGRDVASALRAAQLDRLNNKTDPRSVLAWAPFQAIGHASSPFAPAETQRRNNP